ncbi:helix-turn-helix transcriptional regulator [Curtobacterium sp. B18]|uniref:helix-turn-helix transcriptional regulator n=1 Tax=Curtobacterium sp. B18 TaxID=95614 RepID=UPI0034D9792C
MVLQLLLRAVLVLLERGAAAAADDGVEDPLATRFRKEVERRFTELHTVAEYAQVLGHSIRTISRAVAQGNGTSPKQLIDRRIALEAQRLLGYTDLPVARIAERLGFTEATNFSRFFQRTTGISATRFRTERRPPVRR